MNLVLVKISGKMVDTIQTDPAWRSTFTQLQQSFDGVIVVHGAGVGISAWSQRFDIPSHFIDGQRVTCARTVEIVAAVQSGLVNARLVSWLQTAGFPAIGLTGIDRGLFLGHRSDPRLGYVGSPVVASDPGWVKELAAGRTIPVFSSLCRDAQGNLLNVNADLFAEALARALDVHTALFISDVSGVRLGEKICPMLGTPQIQEGIDSGAINGGMIPKVNSAISLVKSGVRRVWIGDRIESITINGCGTTTRGTWIVAA